MPTLLLTNDDGIHAPGLAALAESMAPLGEVWVYAPDREQSAVGHGVSLARPLRVTERRERWFAVDGTPTDCVMLAVRDLLGVRPDAVVSGINAGPNLGDDVTYSGTVAGAYEGMLLGVPSVAVSCASYTPTHFAAAGEAAVKVVSQVLAHGLPDATMLNVNVPDIPAAECKGMRVVRLGRRHYEDEIVRRVDPRGKPYYWIGGTAPSMEAPEDTDLHAVAEGYVSITPLQRDITNHAMLGKLKNWDL